MPRAIPGTSSGSRSGPQKIRATNVVSNSCGETEILLHSWQKIFVRDVAQARRISIKGKCASLNFLLLPMRGGRISARLVDTFCPFPVGAGGCEIGTTGCSYPGNWTHNPR